MVVGVLIHWILLHFKRGLKAAQISGNLYFTSSNWAIMLQEKKKIKNICCAKGEGIVNSSTVTRWFEKFWLGCKNLDNQARSDRPKTVDSKAILQAIDANSESI